VAQSAPKAVPVSFAGSVAALAAPLATAQASSSARLVRMVDHPLRHRFDFIDARIPRHQQEVREIAASEDACQYDVHPFSGLQTKIPEGDEGDGAHRER